MNRDPSKPPPKLTHSSRTDWLANLTSLFETVGIIVLWAYLLIVHPDLKWYHKYAIVVLPFLFLHVKGSSADLFRGLATRVSKFFDRWSRKEEEEREPETIEGKERDIPRAINDSEAESFRSGANEHDASADD